MQRTLIIFKPDCVQRRLVGEILGRFEAKGLRIAALKLMQVDRALGEKHYAEHKDRPFFGGLIDFITGGPSVVGVLEGNEAVAVVRTMLGATNGVAAAPGTVRGDFSISKQNNLDPRLRQRGIGEARDRPLVQARGAGLVRDRRGGVGLRGGLTDGRALGRAGSRCIPTRSTSSSSWRAWRSSSRPWAGWSRR